MKKTVGCGIFYSDKRISASIYSDWKDKNEQIS